MPGPAFKRPVSVLVVVHTADEVLLMERTHPVGFWQSVTGSLLQEEHPLDAARRELHEETGFSAGDMLVDLQLVQRFQIAAEWSHRFPPGTRENVEHAFSLALSEPAAPRLNPDEHLCFEWLPAGDAIDRASSWTNRAAIAKVFPALDV